MLELKKLAGPLAKKELTAAGYCRRNGKREMKIRSRSRYQMIDNIMINVLYEDTKRKAVKRVVENAEFAVKDLPSGRTL